MITRQLNGLALFTFILALSFAQMSCQNVAAPTGESQPNETTEQQELTLAIDARPNRMNITFPANGKVYEGAAGIAIFDTALGTAPTTCNDIGLSGAHNQQSRVRFNEVRTGSASECVGGCLDEENAIKCACSHDVIAEVTFLDQRGGHVVHNQLSGFAFKFSVAAPEGQHCEEGVFVDDDPVGPGPREAVELLTHYPGRNSHSLTITGDGNYLFMISDPLDLQVVDIQNPNRPVIVKSIDIPGQASQYMAQRNGYLYLGTSEGVQIVDAREPTLASLVGSVSLGPQVIVRSIAASSANRLYTFDTNGKLNTFDLSSPASPRPLSSIDIGRGFAGRMLIDGSTLFLARASDGLEIYNVSGTSPNLLARYSHDAPIYKVAKGPAGTDTLILAMEGAGMGILDIRNLSAPTYVDALQGVDGGRQMVSSGGFVYAAEGDSGVGIYELRRQGNGITQERLSRTTVSAKVTWVAVQGNTLFAGGESMGLSALSVTDGRSPVLLDNFRAPIATSDAELVGEHLFYSTSSTGLQRVHINDPTRADNLNLRYATEIASVDRTLAVLDNRDVKIFDVSLDGTLQSRGRVHLAIGSIMGMDFINPSTLAAISYRNELMFVDVNQLVIVGSMRFSDSLLAMAVEGNLIWVGHGANNLSAVDVSDPRNPRLLGSVQVSGSIISIAVQGSLALVSTNARTLDKISISRPSAPVLLRSIPTDEAVGAITFSGDVALASTYGTAIFLIDLMPSWPIITETLYKWARGRRIAADLSLPGRFFLTDDSVGIVDVYIGE